MVFCFALTSAGAFAHHEGGAVDNLQAAAQNLNQTVVYSTLRYAVKNAVYQFVANVNNLGQCVDMYPDHDRHHESGIPPACYPALDYVQRSFSQVNYYLGDAFDYPQVYQAYVATQNAMAAIVD
jgi:hypothetical protein